MFTGIIRNMGMIASKEPKGDGLFVRVISKGIFADAQAGDSMAINGVCLTVISSTSDETSFELGAETLRKTTFNALPVGQPVNIEFPMRLGDTLDGHMVQGHVDATAEVTGIRPDGETTWLTIKLPDALAPLVVKKGSIAVDGVSLTVAEKDGATIGIMLLPYTVEHTAFFKTKVGDKVNIETDMLARHVAELVRAFTKNV